LLPAIRIEPAPIPELITAEGTVVEGKSEQAEQTAQGVPAPAVDLIRLAESHQLAVVAKRALTPALERGDERPVEVGVSAAMVAVKRGSGDDPARYVPAAARSMAPAFAANRHRVSKAQMITEQLQCWKKSQSRAHGSIT
jgi:hypothetical protein